METSRKANRQVRLAAFGLALIGCGGGTGTVALRLTDAPPDTDNMAAVTVSLRRVDVHVAGEKEEAQGDEDKSTKETGHAGGWHTLTMSPPHAFDLLKLQNDVSEALGELSLPPGKLTQIRLFVDDTGKNEVTLKTGQSCRLDLKGVDREGIKINHPFKALDVKEGQTLEVLVDFDLKESVSKEGDCAYRLAPVIKLKSSRLKD